MVRKSSASGYARKQKNLQAAARRTIMKRRRTVRRKARRAKRGR